MKSAPYDLDEKYVGQVFLNNYHDKTKISKKLNNNGIYAGR